MIYGGVCAFSGVRVVWQMEVRILVVTQLYMFNVGDDCLGSLA